MTNQGLAHRNFMSASSRSSRRANTLLAQMADLARGERIKTLREGRHLTQPAVADEIGVTLRAYQAWEATGALKWENAKKLAAFYKVDAQDLWSGDERLDTPDVIGSLNGNSASGDTDELRAQLDRIEENQQNLIAIIEAQAESTSRLLDSKLEALLLELDRRRRRAG
jgi:transcriptional regulator with XRE-family HTH domain